MRRNVHAAAVAWAPTVRIWSQLQRIVHIALRCPPCRFSRFHTSDRLLLHDRVTASLYIHPCPPATLDLKGAHGRAHGSITIAIGIGIDCVSAVGRCFFSRARSSASDPHRSSSRCPRRYSKVSIDWRAVIGRAPRGGHPPVSQRSRRPTRRSR